ncbi:MAG TPA: tRNA guanosine(34) transglycosylase Tgt [Levilinea sp.]|nr:tRNA guanosine(34) transglycosylase Tgt [Levilinea sp.]
MNASFPTSFDLPHGRLDFPTYLPDATYGVVRAVDARDLLETGVQAVVMNTFHLMQRPGSTTVTALGGLHKMSGWPRPIVTDSGGFQAYSLIRQNPKFGQLTDRGLIFRNEAGKKIQLSPEKTIQLQMSYGADVVICLDDCTHVDASYAEQQASVRRTIAWARRSRAEYDRLLSLKRLSAGDRPRIFGVIQGGGYHDLRKQCADALLEIGFDGFGYGGWPLDGQGNLLVDMLGYLRELVPAHLPLHALGVGHPENVLACYDLGYGMFDSAMPTRDARHARLYTFTQPGSDPQSGLTGGWLRYVYINDEKNIKADQPVSPFCACLVCRRYSLGYLHHLFKLNDSLYHRLATLHNLHFMVQLAERLRKRTP